MQIQQIRTADFKKKGKKRGLVRTHQKNDQLMLPFLTLDSNPFIASVKTMPGYRVKSLLSKCDAKSDAPCVPDTATTFTQEQSSHGETSNKAAVMEIQQPTTGETTEQRTEPNLGFSSVHVAAPAQGEKEKKQNTKRKKEKVTEKKREQEMRGTGAGVTLAKNRGNRKNERPKKQGVEDNIPEGPKSPDDENFYMEEHLEVEKNMEEISAEMPSINTSFFSEISKYPLLSPEKEHELALKIRNEQDPDAFHLFLMSNLRLALACVRDVMRRMGGNTILDFMDLAQEAVLGLMTAVERFDPSRGTRFSTYGLYWIYQRVKRAIVSQRKGMSVPGFAGESVFAMTDYIALYNKGKEHEIPKRFRNRVKDLARITNHVMSFGENESDADTGRQKTGVVDEERFADREKDSSNCFLGDEAMSNFFKFDFHRFLDSELSPYEADIVRRKFGLIPYNIPASCKEIGIIHGKSSETIRLNVEAVLKKLRKNKQAEKFMTAWLKQN